MAFIAPIFTRLKVTLYTFVGISCTEYFPNSKKSVDNREEFRSRNSIECAFRFTEFRETIPRWSNVQIFYEYIKFHPTRSRDKSTGEFI